jgi:hypothetical protein
MGGVRQRAGCLLEQCSVCVWCSAVDVWYDRLRAGRTYSKFALAEACRRQSRSTSGPVGRCRLMGAALGKARRGEVWARREDST